MENLKVRSKYLSLLLRHKPDSISLDMDPGGWVRVEQLLAQLPEQAKLTETELRYIVSTSDKQRFSFDVSGTRIRANQGHSIKVDLDLQEAVPPTVLYNGTAETNLPAILQKGILSMQRNHVHLSSDIETALRVGGRHGAPMVLNVDTLKARELGITFYLSENGVWLTSHIPSTCITFCRTAKELKRC